MQRVCQGFSVVFGVAALASQALHGVPEVLQHARDSETSISVEVVAWTSRPFADVALDNPELAAAAVLSPGVWGRLVAPETVPDQGELQRRLNLQLVGLLPTDEIHSLRVVVARLREGDAVAVAHGGTALLALSAPGGEPIDPATLLATTLIGSRARPAAPDERCGEPVLGLADALVQTGVLSLAGLNPSLRPVRDWLEGRDATPALGTLASTMLDEDVPWATRRAHLASLARGGTASPELAHAAALVVEAFGDAPGALRRPFDLLLAWRENRDDRFPSMPAAMKRAVASPLEAGMPKRSQRAELEGIAASALERRIRAGTLPDTVETEGVSPTLRALAAATARRVGRSGACTWLESAAAPAAARLGCSAPTQPGFVYARPRPHGFEVVARLLDGSEATLLSWPRWLLSPQVDLALGELSFIDDGGIWTVALDGKTSPRLRAAGSFRHLAVGLRGLAAARWPQGTVMLLTATAALETKAGARGGLAWLEPDVLVASDGETLTLLSAQGESRPTARALPCCRAVASMKEGVLASRTEPCGPAIVRVGLLSGEDAVILTPSEGPAGLTLLRDTTLVFATSEGLWSWRGGDRAERIGVGLTPAAFYFESASPSSR